MRRFIADTHALLWFAEGESRRLGHRARRAFDTMGTRVEIFVSVVTLWEIAILQEKNRIRLRVGFSAWCDALETYPGLHIEPLMRSDVEEARGLGELPDPHDRLIAGTALRLGVPLISQDALLAAGGRLRVLW